MDKNPHLTPWIIPRWCVMGFCAQANSYENYYVAQIIEHSPTEYLVVTHGFYPFAHTELERHMERLFKVEDEQATEV